MPVDPWAVTFLSYRLPAQGAYIEPDNLGSLVGEPVYDLTGQ